VIDECCELETRVLDAAASGRWDPALLRHLDECSACADLALAAGVMKREALAGTEPDVPDAELVWWKAQVRARRDAAEKATRPIAVAEKTACIGGGLALVVVLAFLWPYLQSWGDWMISNWRHESQAAPLVAVGLLSMLFAGFVSVLLAVGLGLYYVWSDR
jgi:hypothetical protein